MDDLLNLIDDENSKDSTVSNGKKSKGEGEPKKKRRRLSDSVNEEDHLTLEEELEMEHDNNSNNNDEDDEFSLEKLKEKTLKSVRNDLMMMDDDQDEIPLTEDKQENIQVVTKAPATQTAFQSSSTPLNLPERYMVWNSIGLITQFMKDGDESIDIEFHNATYHHTIHIKNQFGYTMADMSKEAVVMASPGIKMIMFLGEKSF